MPIEYSLQLAKEYFHFSASHFTIFGAESREWMHGHNYYLTLSLFGDRLEDGCLVDIERLRPEVRQLCEELDHQILLPAESPHLRVDQIGDVVQVSYGASEFRFPLSDVTLLPVNNITMENLAHHFATAIWERLAAPALSAIEVHLEETRGQRAGVRISK
ncbi:MAG: 6-carboxytetrahydropterin synthase [Myxococcales bacterium]|nr:6-carboxytetrahydropterin synthase [Myxococcales bacterium]